MDPICNGFKQLHYITNNLIIRASFLTMRFKFILLGLIAISYLIGHQLIDRWKENFFYGGDTFGYYLHVVSFFVNGDVGDYDTTVDAKQAAFPKAFDPRDDEFMIRSTSTGRKYIKYTVGVALMETPFFWMAHLFAGQSTLYEANGWTLPYFLMVSLSVIFYVLLGFYLLIKVLEAYFSEKVIILTVTALALATNLYYQSTYSTMAHGFLFFDYCLLIYLTYHFYKKPNIAKALFVGMTVGLITITRVPEVISGLIPIFWGIHNKESLLQRIQFIKSNYRLLFMSLAGFFSVFSIQMAYWYYTSGYLIFNPYEGEGFNFLDPKIWKGWFDFENGWLIYTPVMGFSLIGLIWLKKYANAAFWPLILFTFFNAYIHYSYYVWNYFPGLGQRPMVETYPILSFGLASFFAVTMKKRWSQWAIWAIVIFFIWLNLFQTWQSKKGIIWSERGSWAFYYQTFGQTKSSINALRAFDTKEPQPNESKLTLQNRLYFDDFQATTLPSKDLNKPDHQRTFYPMNDHIEFLNLTNIKEVSGGDWLKISLEAFLDPKDKLFIRDKTAILIVELYNEKQRRKKSRYIRVSSYIGNSKYSIWDTGTRNQWGEASFFIKAPKGFNSNWKLLAIVKNPHHQEIYLDNFYIEHFID